MACDDLITNQDLENAKKDAATMSDFVESDSPEIQSKNGKNIRTLQGINDDADNLISSLGGTDIGDYEDDLTLNSYSEYVVFDRAGATTGPSLWKAIPPRTPTPGTPLPYTIDSATYPDPASDPNIEPFSDINKVGAEQIAQEEANAGDSQLAGGIIYPTGSQDSASTSPPNNNVPVGTKYLRNGSDQIFIISPQASGVISSIDFSSGTATIGGTIVSLKYWKIKRYINDSTNSAVDNMINGYPLQAKQGDIVSTGGTLWQCRTNSPSSINNFYPLSEIMVDDFGAVGIQGTDDTIPIQRALDLLQNSQFIGLTPNKNYDVTNLVMNVNNDTGRNGIVCNGGYGRLRFTGTGVGLDVQGSTSTPATSNWYTQFKNIRFTSESGSGIHTNVRIGGGDTWYSRFDKCQFEGIIGQTIQNLCLTNTDVNANRDYFTLMDNCTFRNADYHVVGGGDWGSGTLVRCEQAVNRIRMSNCDFYDHQEYGLAIYRASGGDASNGWMINQLHTDRSFNAKGDISLSGSLHHIEGVFESNADCVIDLQDAAASAVCNISAIVYPYVVRLNGAPYGDNTFVAPYPDEGPQGFFSGTGNGQSLTIKSIRTGVIDSGQDRRLRFFAGQGNMMEFYQSDYTDPQNPVQTLRYNLQSSLFAPRAGTPFLGESTFPWGRSYANDAFSNRIISTTTDPSRLYSGSTNNTFHEFRESSDGGVSSTLHYSMRNSEFLPHDTTKNLGSASNRWGTVFANNGTIDTSDEREKKFYSIEDAERECAKQIKSVISKFKWNDAIAAKGEENARYHFGVGAQTVRDAFMANGLDPEKYGLFCYDEWEEETIEIPPVYDAEGNIESEGHTEVKEAGNRYGVRYSELAMFILCAI